MTESLITFGKKFCSLIEKDASFSSFLVHLAFLSGRQNFKKDQDITAFAFRFKLFPAFLSNCRIYYVKDEPEKLPNFQYLSVTNIKMDLKNIIEIPVPPDSADKPRNCEYIRVCYEDDGFDNCITVQIGYDCSPEGDCSYSTDVWW